MLGINKKLPMLLVRSSFCSNDLKGFNLGCY